MKKLLLSAFVTASLSNAFAQTTLFQDDIESYSNFIITNIGNYQLFDKDGLGTYIGGITTTQGVLPWTNAYSAMVCQVFNPAVAGVTNGHDGESSDFTPHSGSKYLAFWGASSNTTTPVNNDWLVLPKLTMGTGNKFTFWVKSLATDYGLEKYKVAIFDGTNGAPTSSSTFTTIGAASRNAPATWTQVSVDIPASYNGKPVYLAINYISSDVYMMMVDDISVTTAAVLGTTEASAKSTAIYPNPSKDVFNIKSDKKVESAEVYSTDGKLVAAAKGAAQVNLGSQPAGVYVMKVTYSDGSQTSEKLIKK